MRSYGILKGCSKTFVYLVYVTLTDMLIFTAIANYYRYFTLTDMLFLLLLLTIADMSLLLTITAIINYYRYFNIITITC